jgi:hypothetical protein
LKRTWHVPSRTLAVLNGRENRAEGSGAFARRAQG